MPQANQQIFATQPLIAANFAFLESAIGAEHNFTTTSAPLTYHTKMSLPNTAIAETAHPTPITGADGIAYAQEGGPGTAGEAGLRFYSTVGNKIFRFCDSKRSANGFQWIGGVLMQWGKATFPDPGNITITYPITYTSSVYSLQMSLTGSTSGSTETLISSSVTAASAFIQSSKASSTSQFFWLTIGF